MGLVGLGFGFYVLGFAGLSKSTVSCRFVIFFGDIQTLIESTAYGRKA